MPLGLIRVDPVDFPDEEMTCLRCGQTAPMRFAGPCAACAAALRAVDARRCADRRRRVRPEDERHAECGRAEGLKRIASVS